VHCPVSSPVGVSRCSGSPDFDLRSSEADLIQIAQWVSRCGSCGYCYSSIDELVPALSASELAELVSDHAFQRKLSDGRYPELVNSFRCMATLLSASSDSDVVAQAAHTLLFGAWVCDDYSQWGIDSGWHPSQTAALARQLRRQAAERMRSALEGQISLLESAETGWLVLADTYRRAEIFPSAHTATVRGLAVCDSAAMHSLLLFEQHLVAAQETRAVRISEAFVT
jgi:hypothetical protein